MLPSLMAEYGFSGRTAALGLDPLFLPNRATDLGLDGSGVDEVTSFSTP